LSIGFIIWGIQVLRSRVKGFGFWVQGLEFMGQMFGFGVQQDFAIRGLGPSI
jgi:hypothetical protein